MMLIRRCSLSVHGRDTSPLHQTYANGGRREACPLSPGDVVSGKVSKRQDKEGAVMMELSSTPIPKDSATSSNPGSSEGKENDSGTANMKRKSSTVRGVLPHVHVGDHASVCGNLAARLTPGTKVDRLVVLAVSEWGVPSVSMKPLLVSAMSSPSGGSSGAFVPREASGVCCGDLVAGFVSRVESFGVFVRFLERFSALCPKSKVAEWHVDDPRGMFMQGDSVRCVSCPTDVVRSRPKEAYLALYMICIVHLVTPFGPSLTDSRLRECVAFLSRLIKYLRTSRGFSCTQ